jgi:threonine/homoserine/homoserine lactone efflux protein
VGADLVVLGLAVAASPFPVIPAILLLFAPGAPRGSLGFLAGWVLGIAVATGAFALLAGAVELLDEPPVWASWARVVLGTLLVIVGVEQWLTRRRRTDTPAWMRSLDSLEPRGALRLGFLLSAANPKILMLAAGAGLAIGSAGLGVAAAVATVAAFTAIAASTVALPLVLYATLGDRILEPLGAVRDWLQLHNATVMSIVITAIGLALLAKGVGGL